MDGDLLKTWIVLIIGSALTLSPFVAGFVAAIKTALGTRLPDAYYPVVSVFVGTGLAYLFLPSVLSMALRDSLLAGGVAGLMASGLYTAGKAIDRAMPSPTP